MLADIAVMRKKKAALEFNAQVADGSIEVTVNARGQLVKTVIGKSYLDDHDFENLGDYISEAPKPEMRMRRIAEMAAPINERYRSFPWFSDIVKRVPDPRDRMPPRLDAVTLAARISRVCLFCQRAVGVSGFSG
jgi:DNA-binding protein YbaB